MISGSRAASLIGSSYFSPLPSPLCETSGLDAFFAQFEAEDCRSTSSCRCAEASAPAVERATRENSTSCVSFPAQECSRVSTRDVERSDIPEALVCIE
jgi:hypothetical protein